MTRLMRSKVIIGVAVLVTVICVAVGGLFIFWTCCKLPLPPGGATAGLAPLLGEAPSPQAAPSAAPMETGALTPPPEEAGALAPPPAGPSDAPSFDIVRIEPNGDGVIAGRAAPGWKVGVESGGVRLAEVTADEEGAWTVVLDTPLAAGKHALTLKATSPDGGQSLASSQTVPVAVSAAEVKTAAPETVASIAPSSAKPAAAGAEPLTAAKPSALKPASESEAVATKPGAQTVKTGVPASQTLKPEGPGQQALAPPNVTPHAVTPDTKAPAEVAARKQAAQLPQTASVDNGREVSPSTLAEQLKPGTYTIQRGDTLWAIAERYLGAGWRYTSIYRDNRSKIKNPNLIHPEQEVSVPEE
jgi:nucleoid-associated protein YgaU